MRIIKVKIVIAEYAMNLLQKGDYTDLEVIELAEEGAKKAIIERAKGVAKLHKLPTNI